MLDDEQSDSNADSDSHLLRCVECCQFTPARETDDGELIPTATAARGCPNCGGEEFEQVMFDPDDSNRNGD
ncbi:MAG TPA: hypothetical protein VFJ06_03745 [Halococcus sp.]|nr:hypothetical protein [Halococcus sp.]